MDKLETLNELKNKQGGILILGAYGFGNMGDEAILQGILEKMKNKENVDVVSATPRETEILHQVKSISMKQVDLAKYSAVILGGGGYRPGNYKIPLEICLKLKEKGGKVIVKAIGLTPEIAGRENFGSDPLEKKEKRLLREVVKKADYFSVRTYRDLRRIKKYVGISKKIKVETDPAYYISFSKERGKELLERFGFSLNNKLCGVSVAKFGYREGVKAFLEKYKEEFTLIPIPMCRHYYAGFENDIILLKKYFKELKLLSKNIIRWLKYPFTPSELKGVLSNLHYLITARKHAMILALGGGLTPQQILLLGTKESGMAEYFNVKEIDWRKWLRSPDGLEYIFAKKLIDLRKYSRLIRKNGFMGILQWLIRKR